MPANLNLPLTAVWVPVALTASGVGATVTTMMSDLATKPTKGPYVQL